MSAATRPCQHFPTPADRDALHLAALRLTNLPALPRRHVLTIAVEDYYHAGPLRPWIRQETWYRFETRIEASTRRALDLLRACQVRATFFLRADTVDQMPELVRDIVGQGHEAATLGPGAVELTQARRGDLLETISRERDQLERVARQRVLGFRMADGWLSPAHMWLLDVLAEAGYGYDSSERPTPLRDPMGRSRGRTPRGDHRADLLQAVPGSPVSMLGLRVPLSACDALRQIPAPWMRRAVAHWDRHRAEPFVMHFHTWELDPAQPRFTVSAAARIRQYRNLERMPALLQELLSAYRFTSVADHLGLSLERAVELGEATRKVVLGAAPAPAAPAASPLSAAVETGLPVTIVIPCYNEGESLRCLRKTLERLTTKFAGEYRCTFLFVDDGSTDGTWSLLEELFGGRRDCRLVRHERNRGVAAAIQTGIREAPTDIVCSMDCDCTYDPHELARMIPLLVDGVDVVTASPYHPAGGVRNVPAWRLFLSRGLSRLYRLALRQKLFTYTSCFRVYRRQSAAAVELSRSGFLGVAELIARLDQEGRTIVEHPATLEVRVLGQSKMKVLHTILGHVQLLAEIVQARVARGWTRRIGVSS